MIDFDAWSHGQIESKIWLCEKIEEYYNGPKPKIWILAGWYGITAFLLLSRNNMQIKQIRSFDIDPNCEDVADKINNTWEFDSWKFKAFTCDCNTLKYNKDNPNIVINTATEHFESTEWWDNIPRNSFIAIQGNNMNEHKDHCFTAQSLEEFKVRFQMQTTHYIGVKKFKYPNLEYDRYMILGEK